MKQLKKVITILSDFPMVDEEYVLGSTEDGKYFFSWNWDIEEELPDEEILQGESGIRYHDTLKEAAQDMKEAIEASEHLLNDEDVQEALKELDSILAEKDARMHIRIEESLKNDFYSKCEENFQTPSVVLRGLIKKFVEEEN